MSKDFRVIDPWEQYALCVMPLAYDHLEKFVAFSHADWRGSADGDTWFGRGFGDSNPEYISRYIMPENAQLTRLVPSISIKN